MKNLLTVAVLDHVHHLVAFRISCFRHYGLIRFADVGVAAALLDKTGGTLWVIHPPSALERSRADKPPRSVACFATW